MCWLSQLHHLKYFHSKPLEIIIASVDEKINEVWGDSQIIYKNKNGKTISIYSFCLIYKYTLILGVVENLGSDFGQVKDVIEQEITSMMENPSTLMEITDFQQKLVQDKQDSEVQTRMFNEQMNLQLKQKLEDQRKHYQKQEQILQV